MTTFTQYRKSYQSGIPISDIKNVVGPHVFIDIVLPIPEKHRVIRVFLFGEFHQTPHCPKPSPQKKNVLFPDFLLTLLEESPDMVDLYVELPYLSSSKAHWSMHISQDTVLNGFREEPFASCLSYNKQKCTFNNIRAHYIDYRSAHAIPMESKLSFIIDVHMNAKNFDDIDTKYNLDAYEKTIIDFIHTNPRLLKQLQFNVPRIRDILVECIITRLQLLFKKAKTCQEDGDFDTFKVVTQSAIPSILVDIYGIARMLREFTDKTFSETAIVYAGVCHIANFMYVLQNMGGIVLKKPATQSWLDSCYTFE